METLSIADVSNIFEAAVNYNETDFPFFPAETDDSPYAKHMKTTVQILETWIYGQGFYRTKFVKIPEGFTVQLPGPNSKEKEFTLPYIQLLNNLAGQEFGRKFVNWKK